MKILIAGSGAGAQALAWKLLQDPAVEKVWLAPGNPATSCAPGMENIPVSSGDVEGLARAALELKADFTLITPTQTLAAGVADYFKSRGLPIIAPTREASRLEWSKGFSKKFMKKYQIPTPYSAICESQEQAQKFADTLPLPVVIKADGMVHGGTGVVIAQDRQHVKNTLEEFFTRNVGPMLVEEFIEGEEVSYTILFDGKNYLPLAESRDYKKLLDGDKGPNTGGMGAYSPVLSSAQHEAIITQIVEPCLAALNSEGIEYIGFLYFGVMIDKKGMPSLLEINCRLGNPEVFTILERLESPLHELFILTLQKQLGKANVRWSKLVSVALQISSEGYPFTERKGDELILPLPSEDTHIFHSSVVSDDGKLISHGGRVIALSSIALTFNEAREKLYETVKQVHFEGMHYRTDIALNINTPSGM
ncbi:phosphoribosylamine--glycine ligase [Photorhabdus laumondii subsp. laumondii]|uniref:phosphoribosylamine--glycine ligase n=5 Tax=Photorhabdus TaxID=29487 RepID=Q7N4W6_PHOLL|nr:MULTISPECIES: phosphoribosylamine--glycine ligase [Photorhabdus]AXG47302.1 phosphoribosylamine--glycine ligase [Photorhabdus laumondii subsp. laumondii]MCC8373715.1 phosphoribosylamine--glycine ligase [Photorhabdus bodei]MCC8383762.1 phosphoribosylamine--glycine ligase [Photorhabdus laumondii]MCC8414897.1 phosphoribosylamine--glycine ligase [Photorhabdus laumondii]MCC8463759.1 phosphoribosylamine--glycine ligase [Photorhabdus bodei]